MFWVHLQQRLARKPSRTPEEERLERWLAKAVVATSVGEVLDGPS
jgi:hypothetical protein